MWFQNAESRPAVFIVDQYDTFIPPKGLQFSVLIPHVELSHLSTCCINLLNWLLALLQCEFIVSFNSNI